MANFQDKDSAPRQPSRGFSPPRWIVSVDDERLLHDAIVAQYPVSAPGSLDRVTAATTRVQQGGIGSRWHEQGDDFVPYGPQTRRRGPMTFVRATQKTTASSASGDEGVPLATRATVTSEGKAKGTVVRGIYEELVGLRKRPETPPAPPPAQSPKHSVDVDLTGESSNDEEDDLVIIEEDSGLPAQRQPSAVTRDKQLGIHDLLPSDLSTPREIPVQYGVRGVGYQMIKRLGWVEGQALGKPEAKGSESAHAQKRLKVPLKASDKFDRTGIGIVSKDGNPKLTRRELEKERQRLATIERDKRGRGSRGMEKQKVKEKQERAALMYYMNH